MILEDSPLIREAATHADLNAIFDKIGEAITIVDANWRVKYINDVYFRYSGLTREQVEGKRVFEFAPNFRQSIFYESIERSVRERRETRKISFSPVLKQWMRCRTVPYDDGAAIFMRTASEDDVSEHLRSESAVTDSLTGLRNKAGMGEDVAELARNRAPFHLLIIGVEGLKAVNDSHGYDVVDMCLLELTAQLKASMEEGDTLYRLATDELGAICFGDEDDVIRKAQKLSGQVALPIALRAVRIRLGASIGLVNGLTQSEGFEQLLKRCSLALTRARRQRSDRPDRIEAIQVFSQDLEAAASSRLMLQDELRTALPAGQFKLLIQPKVSLATGRVVGGETLLRWNHPGRGVLTPGVFLEAASDIGLMPAIDDWVLRHSIGLAKELDQAGISTPVSVNLGCDSFDDALLPTRIATCLQEYQLPPHLLEVEIPEGALMRDVERAVSITTELRVMGVLLSIDDFGTGYSSFAYLAQFPVHTLKIDRSFILELERSKAKQTIVRGIITMAHHLSLDVVAEGAEDTSQISLLKKMRCDKIQGYYYARPLAVEDFIAFHQERAARAVPAADAL